MRFVSVLTSPYAHHVSAAASLRETHVSYVFLLGERAYKLKKPVRYDFVDLSTRERREEICRREVELNRRLAPDVYLGVLDVVDENGRPVDHLVEMRRLPDERRLATLVRNAKDVSACLRRLARDVAAFHSDAATSDEIGAAASPDVVRKNWTDNLDTMERFTTDVLDGSVLDKVRSRAGRYLDGRESLFSARVTGGHIRDGHGDLLADDVFCLDDGPRALDCIEFDDRLRWGDVVADVAFLAMDLERLGARELADRFLAWYREFSGESHPRSLADHYVAYRASVRSKVACLKNRQGDEDSRKDAQALLALCDRRLDLARVRLVLVGGLPGTGKSTFAAELSARTGWTLLRSDEVRKDLTGTAHSEHPDHGFEEGIYRTEITERTYGELLTRANTLLGLGESVVLDASWGRAAHRSRAARVAQETSSDLFQLRCVLPFEIAEQRMRERAGDRTDPSDANAEIARAMAQASDPWPEAVEASTEPSPDLVTQRVLREVLAPPV
jgi:hypothetical protein